MAVMENAVSCVEEKCWGSVQHIFDGPVSVSLLRVNAGTFCSTHKHVQRYNQFHVVSGKLLIVTYSDAGDTLHEKFILTRGMRLTIPPDMYHRFEVLMDGRVVEIYWTKDSSEARLDDIVRVREGGQF